MKGYSDSERAENEAILLLIELVTDGDITLETALKHAEKFKIKDNFLKSYDISQKYKITDKLEEQGALEVCASLIRKGKLSMEDAVEHAKLIGIDDFEEKIKNYELGQEG